MVLRINAEGYLVGEYGFDAKRYPIEAVSFIKDNHISGRMYNAYFFGGYLIYALYPDENYRVFIDGRAEFYGKSIFSSFVKVDALYPDWESTLESYGVTWVIHQAGSAVSSILLEDPDWKLVYSDLVANIYLKDIPQHMEVIKRFPNVKLAEKQT